MSHQQAFATCRDLEEIGIARDAIQALPLAVRRRTLRAASGVLAPYLRKRAGLPLAAVLEPDDFDVSGMTGGASVVYAPTGTATPHARDVRITFAAGGVVATPGITYTVDLDDGAFGSTPSAPVALPLDGRIVVDGYTFIVAGTVTIDDAFAFCLRLDAGAMAATCQVAAYLLLGSRGIDPTTLERLEAQHDGAIAWAKDVGKGEGDLEADADATPARAEAGPRGTGQTMPWQYLRNRRGGWRDE